ncbi:MAG TPA: VOC family protein [Thermoflexales bacterium]|nr:VOC family protein [Thermoflexales bacterium]HQW35835.1 VOC family protein [Thermoflexales bacterium]
MSILGLGEASLQVRDVARAVAFYRDIVGLELAKEDPAQNMAVMWLGKTKDFTLALWGTGNSPFIATSQITLNAEIGDVVSAPLRLRARGVATMDFAGNTADEPYVIGWLPAAAIYFLDPDGNSVELRAMLGEPPREGLFVWSNWQSGAKAITPTAKKTEPRNALAGAMRTYEILFKRKK